MQIFLSKNVPALGTRILVDRSNTAEIDSTVAAARAGGLPTTSIASQPGMPPRRRRIASQPPRGAVEEGGTASMCKPAWLPQNT